MNFMENRRVSGTIRRLGVFTGNMLVGTFMYLAVLLLAAASNVVVDWVATWCDDGFMLTTMRLVGNTLMILDGILLVWTAAVSTYRAFKA